MGGGKMMESNIKQAHQAFDEGLIPNQNNKLKDGTTFDPGKLNLDWERRMDRLGLGHMVQKYTGWKYTREEEERPEREAHAEEEATRRNMRAARNGRVTLVSEDETASKLGV